MTMARKTIFVTGAAGFVGAHLLEALRNPSWQDARIVATAKDLSSTTSDPALVPLDITNADAIAHEIRTSQPTHLIHLAALPTIAEAQTNFVGAWQVNVQATLNIARSILEHAPACTLIFASSAEVYGATGKSGKLIGETALLAPTNEYAATKAAADLALGALVFNGLKLIRFRPFNHTGPGQSDQFVVPAFASQIARIEAGQQDPVIRVGNLDAKRDFLDVRDVVDAYLLGVSRSDDIASGTVFNVASGAPRSIKSILDRLIYLSRKDVRVEIDPLRQRANDMPIFAGDASRARDILGWSPKRDVDGTLAEILEFHRQKTHA